MFITLILVVTILSFIFNFGIDDNKNYKRCFVASIIMSVIFNSMWLFFHDINEWLVVSIVFSIIMFDFLFIKKYIFKGVV